MISKSLQEYLRTMYLFEKQGKEIRVTDIANKMGCSKPGVNKALNSLKEENLVKYEAYKKIELTEEGKKLAVKILQEYDIVNLFLTEVLNLRETEVEEEAKKIKMAMSDKILAQLEKYVHNLLDLSDLKCNYDTSSEKCKKCIKIRTIERIRKASKKESVI